MALVIDGGDSPGGARALSVRGRASVETVDGVVEEYLMAGRKSVGDEAAAAFEAERFLGAGPERPMLSMQRAYAVHTHGTVTGSFVGSIARRSRDGREPPPPIESAGPGHARYHNQLVGLTRRSTVLLRGEPPHTTTIKSKRLKLGLPAWSRARMRKFGCAIVMW